MGNLGYLVKLIQTVQLTEFNNLKNQQFRGQIFREAVQENEKIFLRN